MRGASVPFHVHTSITIHSNPQPASFDPRRAHAASNAKHRRHLRPPWQSQSPQRSEGEPREVDSWPQTLGGPYDPSKVVAQLEGDIALIEAGLAKLDNVAAA
jgi:hypothetical protein